MLVNLGLLQEAQYMIFAFGVVLSAWIGGFGPGMLSTMMSMLAVYLIATYSPSDAPVTLPALAIFFLQSLVISFLGHTRMHAITGLAAAARELESKVQHRTHALSEANQRLEDEAVERERAAAELRLLAAKLEASNRELQDFASVASHDLQEPLRKIQAFGDRLAAKFSATLGDEGIDYIRRMQSASGRMQILITDLLTLSRIASKAQPFATVDLNQIARDVLSDMETRIAETDARVTIGDLPTIQADPTQIRQLFQNLIGNAIKFRKPGSTPEVHVSASVEPGDPGGARPDIARITVSDNGIGFDEKYLDRIFTVFQRLHGRGTYEGTGVGLAVCRRIVERHGGSITAQSRPGEGATFVVTLPVHQEGTTV